MYLSLGIRQTWLSDLRYAQLSIQILRDTWPPGTPREASDAGRGQPPPGAPRPPSGLRRGSDSDSREGGQSQAWIKQQCEASQKKKRSEASTCDMPTVRALPDKRKTSGSGLFFIMPQRCMTKIATLQIEEATLSRDKKVEVAKVAGLKMQGTGGRHV